MEEKNFTEGMVDNLADKLLIGLTKEENKMVLDEFGIIDSNFAVFKDIPEIENAEPMSWCLDRTIDHLREDVVQESVPIDDLLANSDRTSDREIEIPRVVA